jgi:hypothetical protein
LGSDEKKMFWMKRCLFYFYLTFVYNSYVPTYHRFLRQRLLFYIIDEIILLMLKLVSNKIYTYLTSLWRHERYFFSVFRGILPAIFGRFSKKLSISAVVHLDQTILLHIRSSIDRPLNLPPYLGGNNYFNILEEHV